jgi:hypothetical protein
MFDAETVATATMEPARFEAVILVDDRAICQVVLVASVYVQSPVKDRAEDVDHAVVNPCLLETGAFSSKRTLRESCENPSGRVSGLW